VDAIRVLMVDDNPDDLELFNRALRQGADWPCRIVQAQDGDEAYALLMTEGVFDALLLDHKLPGRSGLELLQQWGEDVPELPSVILLTGHGGERIAVEAIKSGAFDYFSKNNCEPEVLAATVYRAAHVTRLRRALAHERGRRAEIEAQLRIAQADPGEMHGVRRTVATFMHEINSPLTGIVGYINMLKDGAEASRETRQIYEEMLEACRGIEHVLHSMEALDEVRVRSGARHNRLLDLRALM
jgi:DNA-binding NtrC family response regulator